MPESTERLPLDVLVSRVRDEQNKIEEERREEFLARNLFHAEVIVQAGFLQDRAEIEANFLREKKGKSMLERFEMATHGDYLGTINVVELGVTTEPSRTGEIDGLKDEYLKLKEHMIATGIVDDEQSREDSGRSLTVERTRVTDDLVVISRNRPLISCRTEIEVTDNGKVPVELGIVKRMVFMIPTLLYVVVAKRFEDPALESEAAVACIEGLLERRDKNISAIRTAYYLATHLV